jgi:hypothetical protein
MQRDAEIYLQSIHSGRVIVQVIDNKWFIEHGSLGDRFPPTLIIAIGDHSNAKYFSEVSD